MSVQYTLYPSNPAAHIFTVSIYIENPNPEGQRFSLPTWIPGSYMIREFSKNIVEIHAKTGDVSIPVRQLIKILGWCIQMVNRALSNMMCMHGT